MKFKYNIGDIFLIKGNNTFLYIVDRYEDKSGKMKPGGMDPELYMTVHIMGENHYYNEHNQMFLTHQVNNLYYIHYPNEV